MGQIINHSLRLYSVHLTLIFLLGIIISQVVTEQDNRLQDVFAESSAGGLFFMAVIMAPLVEELLFRLPLRGLVVNVVLPASLLTIISFVWFAAWGTVFAVGAMLAGLNVYLWFARSKMKAIALLYDKFPRLIFYGLALLFGAIHITNYDARVWPLLPLLVMPQFIVGLLFGFVRLHYGFGWAIAAHAFHNGCLLLPVILMIMFGSSQLQTAVDTPDFMTLPPTDWLLLGFIGIYGAGGLILCGTTAWIVVQEWRQTKTTR